MNKRDYESINEEYDFKKVIIYRYENLDISDKEMKKYDIYSIDDDIDDDIDEVDEMDEMKKVKKNINDNIELDALCPQCSNDMILNYELKHIECTCINCGLAFFANINKIDIIEKPDDSKFNKLCYKYSYSYNNIRNNILHKYEVPIIFINNIINSGKIMKFYNIDISLLDIDKYNYTGRCLCCDNIIYGQKI